MPIEGQQQLRYKEHLEYADAVLNIEREILRVEREKGKVSKEYSADVQNLEKQLSSIYDEHTDALEKQQNLTKKLEILQKKMIAGETPRIRQTASMHLKQKLSSIDLYRMKMVHLEHQLSKEREIIDLKKKQEDESRSQLDIFVQQLGKFGQFFGLQQKSYAWLKKTFQSMNVGLLAVTSTLIALFFEAFSMFKDIDKSLADFRISMGLLRDDSGRIQKEAVGIATEFAHIGVTVEGALAAVKALGNEFGGVRKISKDLTETVSILKSQLGVAEEVSAGFLRNISALGQSTAQAQKHMAWVAKHLASAHGVPLNLVMQDVAKMSDNALSLVSKMPMEIVKAATAARALGTTLNKMAEAGSSLLQFTESVQAEMEASVLIGRSINFQLARELMYRGQIEDGMEELLRLAREVNFEGLDYFQMKAFAAAAGVSVDEMLKMIQAQDQLNAARTNVALGLTKEVELIDRMQRMRDEDLKNEALQTELAVKQMANQERMAALQQQWNKLIMETMTVMYPVINGFLIGLTYAMKWGPALLVIGAIFMNIGTWVTGISSKLMLWIPVLNTIFKLTGNVGITMAWITSGIKGAFTWLSKLSWVASILSKFSFLGPLLKTIPVIGWIITAFQFVYHLMRRMGEGEGFLTAAFGSLYDVLIKPFKGVYDWIMKRFGAGSPSELALSIVKGIGSVGGMIFNVLTYPFRKVRDFVIGIFGNIWSWISSRFGGKSPSELGLSIVKGIVAVQGLLFDALTYPFRRFLAYVLDKIPFMGGIAEKMREGSTGQLRVGGPVEKIAERPNVVPATLVAASPAGTPPPVVRTSASVEDKEEREKEVVKLSEILKTLKELNANLISGKVAVYMDGQLLSNTLARQTAYHGGYGTSEVTIG